MSDQLAIQQPRALQSVALLTGLDQQYLINTLKAQCFKGQASDAQVDAFISIAMEMKVNPLLPGMLYAYPTSGGGIVPIMGPSGVYKKLTEHPDVDSWNVEVFPADVTQPPTHAIARIFRKGTERPLEYTALLSEWKVGSNKNWVDRPRHMLQLRALKHCANQIIHGIPFDEDDRVIMGDPINVTPSGAVPEPQSPAPIQRAEPKARKGAAAAKEAAKTVEAVIEPEPTPAEQPKSEPKNVTPEPTPVADDQPRTITENGKVVRTESPEELRVRLGKQPEPSKGAPRAFLKDGELIECQIEVISSDPKNAPGADGKGIPSVIAVVKGAYCGSVRHLGGGKIVNNAVVIQDIWTPGKKLDVKLRGRIADAKVGTPNHGKILVWVESVTEAAQEF